MFHRAMGETVFQFKRLFDAMGLGSVHFFPPRHANALPAVGPNTRMLLAQPFLADTARALEAHGAQRLSAPFPLGVEGTTAWLAAAASHKSGGGRSAPNVSDAAAATDAVLSR